jgi:LacI family transcriptional regulator
MVSQSRQRTAKRATIKDVANAAGVSVTTVSNVLNGRTEAMTSETLLRIQQTIRQLNYRPSQVARSLVTQQTSTIGVIITEIDTPLFFQTLNDIETVARKADHNILLATTTHNLADEPQVFDLLLEKQVDGIILLSISVLTEKNYLADLPTSIPPIVLINRAVPFTGRFDQINFDHVQGMVNALDHLVSLGHRRIAHLIGPQTRASTHERLKGYRLGLKKHNLSFDENLVRPGNYNHSPAAWEQSTLELLAVSPRPTAIIAANDRVAAIALRTVQNAGLRVPNDISIVGIDDQPFCTYLNPTLTTVQLPIIEGSRTATKLLLELISGQRSVAQHIVLPCPLIVRESTGIAPDGAA